jgi:hypothetical protein
VSFRQVIPVQAALAAGGTGVTKAGGLVGVAAGEGWTEAVGVGVAVDGGVVVGTTAGEAPGVGLAGLGLIMSQPPAARRQQSRKTTA